ncbi:MAG: DUF3566 domain-containing protein [Candidatus Nanopelagicales bacterium]|jgi:hypothetical protein|nr:DUF3566 domain-containing protein [Candidatus Nanopelagicales bacterium]
MTDVARAPKRARLYVTRLDPWSVTKVAFLLSLAIGILLVVAVGVLWWVLDVTGVFLTVSATVDDVVGTAATGFNLMDYVELSRVMGVAVVVASIEIVLVSLLSTIFAILYNLTVGLTGGVEVVLSDDV